MSDFCPHLAHRCRHCAAMAPRFIGMANQSNPAVRPILRPAALLAGYSDDEIRRMRNNKEWSTIRRGGYVNTEAIRPLDEFQRHALLVRATVPGLRLPAVVSHVSAAVLLGIPLWSTDLEQVHITRPQPANSGSSTSLYCHRTDISPDEVATVGGIEITNPARTIIDLARTLPFEQAVVAADGAMFRNLTTSAELFRAVAQIKGAPGSRGAFRVVRFANGLSDGVGESRSRVMMHMAGLPEPALQVDMHDRRGRFLGRSDYAWYDGRLLGEFDGKAKYSRYLKDGESPGDVVFKEKRREDALRDNGSRVVRWVWHELSQPDLVVERIRRAMDSVERGLAS